MITVYPFAKLGKANHGWLNAHHHFSFARYYNPARIGFGHLLVVNDDTVAPGMGFGTHHHEDMEIITYVRQGAITHKDSLGNIGRTEAGDLQVMSAGTGIFHSEYNLETEDTRLYQIWIEPSRIGVQPRWETRRFPDKVTSDERLTLLVSGRAEDAESGALFIHQDATIHGGRFTSGMSIHQPLHTSAYILASAGSLLINGVRLDQGDGAEVVAEDILHIQAESDAEVLVIEAGD